MIVRLAPWVHRIAALVAVGAIACAGCILGPKQDDPVGSPTSDVPARDSGIPGFGLDAATDSSPGGCGDDKTGADHDAALHDAACPNPADSGTFDSAAADGPVDGGVDGDAADSGANDASDAGADTNETSTEEGIVDEGTAGG